LPAALSQKGAGPYSTCRNYEVFRQRKEVLSPFETELLAASPRTYLETGDSGNLEEPSVGARGQFKLHPAHALAIAPAQAPHDFWGWVVIMKELLSPILDDDSLTRGLGDEEARVLIEWLVERTEEMHACWGDGERTRLEVRRACRKARAIGRFVRLWCYEDDPRGATQLAATERFSWPLPIEEMDPCDLMVRILYWHKKTAA